jgi:metal-responsive CopG/Arc/MetJ family transcriptional regulator
MEDEINTGVTGNRRITVSINLTQNMLEAIDFLANEQKRSRSNMVEVLIAHGLVMDASGRRVDAKR